MKSRFVFGLAIVGLSIPCISAQTFVPHKRKPVLECKFQLGLGPLAVSQLQRGRDHDAGAHRRYRHRLGRTDHGRLADVNKSTASNFNTTVTWIGQPNI